MKKTSAWLFGAAWIAGAIVGGCSRDTTARVPAVRAAPVSGSPQSGAGPAPAPKSPSAPPWNQCRREGGTQTPVALGEAVWTNIVQDAPREAYAALVPGRCEYFGLLFEGTDARYADQVFQQVRTFEAGFAFARAAQKTALAGRKAATEPHRVTDEECRGVFDGRCSTVRIATGAEPDALTFEVEATNVNGRYFLASEVTLRAPEPVGEPGDGPPLAPEDAGLIPGIVETAPNTFAIDRAAVTKARPTWEAGIQQDARVVPHYADGTYSGFKLVGVRPTSLFRALGVRSGDTIVAVDGKPIDSPEKARLGYDALKSAKGRVQLDLVRRGRPITLTWNFN